MPNKNVCCRVLIELSSEMRREICGLAVYLRKKGIFWVMREMHICIMMMPLWIPKFYSTVVDSKVESAFNYKNFGFNSKKLGLNAFDYFFLVHIIGT